MKILADNLIPLLDYFFADQAEITAIPFQDISPETVASHDILLTRSQVKIDAALLQCSKPKFIGSCVTGTDHIDKAYLKHKQIPWFAAEGCNTQSVVEYVLSVIAALQSDSLLARSNIKVGIIGAGRIGSRLHELFERMGYTVLAHDPIRAMYDRSFVHSSLLELTDCDVVTLHTPLTQTGPFPSYHLIDKSFLNGLKSGAVLINTARGAVINSSNLVQFGKHLILCLDVFEHEPEINLALVEQAYIATPHIAGHSVQGKQRGTEMVYQAAAKLFHWPQKSMPSTRKTLEVPSNLSWQELLLKLMDPRHESQRMKQTLLSEPAMDLAARFSHLRRTYAKRYELDYLEFTQPITRVWS